MKRLAYLLSVLLLLCTGVLQAKLYTIDFNLGTTNGQANGFTSLPSNNPALFCASGWENIAEYTESNCVYRNTACGIRIGKTNGGGQANFTITFSEEIQSLGIVKIVVYASRGTDNPDAEMGIYAGTNTVTCTVGFPDMESYDASKPESENYILPEVIVERKFKKLMIATRNTNFVMLHRIDIYTADEASIVLPMQNDGIFYTTFSSDRATFFPEDVTVCRVSVIGGHLMLTGIEVKECFGQSGCRVPANTGVLLSSARSEAAYIVLDGETLNPLTYNMLKPASEQMTGSGRFYRLAYSDTASKTGLGFYWGAEEGGAFSSEAGSAYLALPEESNAKGFTLDDATYEDATPIPQISTDEMGVFYNLAGQRIVSPLPGTIYIKGGRKYLAK